MNLAPAQVEVSSMKRIIAPLFALLIAAPLFAQMDHGHDHEAMMGNHDRMFADAMTKHHEDGIHMARMAVEKAQRAELRALAQKMVDDQARQIAEMQRHRPEGPKMSMEAMKDMPGMMPESEMKRDMARLETATGRDFDLVFTEVMPKHHHGAVMMAQHQIDKGSLEPMKAVAREIRDMQSRERQQMLAMHDDFHAGRTTAARASEARRRMTKE
jgi:uncharacterized protein (DUF305 family)